MPWTIITAIYAQYTVELSLSVNLRKESSESVEFSRTQRPGHPRPRPPRPRSQRPDLNGLDLNGLDLNGRDLNGLELNGLDLHGQRELYGTSTAQPLANQRREF